MKWCCFWWWVMFDSYSSLLVAIKGWYEHQASIGWFGDVNAQHISYMFIIFPWYFFIYICTCHSMSQRESIGKHMQCMQWKVIEGHLLYLLSLLSYVPSFMPSLKARQNLMVFYAWCHNTKNICLISRPCLLDCGTMKPTVHGWDRCGTFSTADLNGLINNVFTVFSWYN